MSDVVIIWNENKGDILSRFARVLSAGTNWPIVRKPDPKATINYWMLYVSVAQSPQGLKGLNKTAALFSHYEEEVPKKAQWWNEAAPLVDIRTTWAAQYLAMLETWGDSYVVIPPIDAQFLTPRKKPVIGVSGYVHPGHRKGEHLLKRLYAEQNNSYEIIASGQGWPLPAERVKERKWADMPAFYDSLDLYLVTSLTEGIPMPPLEALARGKRVVVPSGVGLLSELKGRDGVYFYEAGNYESMLVSIEWALKKPENSIKEFTEAAWCESHREAFGLNAGAEIKSREGLVTASPYSIQVSGHSPDEQFIPSDHIKDAEQRYKEINGQPLKEIFGIPVTSISRSIPNSGAIIVAYGAPARECATIALKSWKNAMPAYPVALVSDEPLEIEDVFIHQPDTDIGARGVKTRVYDLAPAEWQNVLYLDADTETVADVSVLFQWLQDGFDFLICTNPGLYSSITKGVRPDNKEELEATIAEIGTGELIQKNGGVFAFSRNERSAAFMRAWNDEWKRWKGRDQFALLRALHKNPVKLLLLTNEFNTIVRFCDPSITAGILHYALRARRWSGVIFGALDSKEAWDRVIK